MGSSDFNADSHSRITSAQARLTTLEIVEKTLDLILFLQATQLIFERLTFENHVMGRIIGFITFYGRAQPPQNIRSLTRSNYSACGVRFADGASPSIPGDQYLACRSGLAKLLLQPAKSVAKSFSLGSLIFKLLRERRAHLSIAQTALERCACQSILLFLNGEFGLSIPLVHGILVLLQLFFEQMLVSNSDGNLCLNLEKLIFHIKHKLFRKLFRIFGFLDQVINIGSQERSYAFE
jgi:hypothetical protein